MRFRPLVLTVAVLCSVTLAGPALAEVPRPEFTERADQTCSRFNPRYNDSVQDLNSVVGYQDLVRAVEELKGVVKDQTRAVQRLPQPATGGRLLRRWYKRTDVVLGRLQDIADAARTQNDQAILAAVRQYRDETKAEFRAARQFGFRVCR